MKILLIGAQGQLGTDVVKTRPSDDYQLGQIDHRDLDITSSSSLLNYFKMFRPDWVINTAAFNRTEECEEKRDFVFAVNAQGAQNVARAAQTLGARLLHVSTDFVFDGAKRSPYVESDETHPLNVYGESKRDGEEFVLKESSDSLVVRGASLFGVAGSSGKGGNFVEAVIKKARAGQEVSVINDIVMSPTYTRDMAARLWELIDKKASGFYHVVNEGACSWFEFAAEAFRLLKLPPPTPVPASAYPSKMRRAPYTALASERLAALGLKPLRPWQEALKAYLKEKGHLS